MKIGLLNYGGGNLRSVENALEFLGFDHFPVVCEADLTEITHLILPGQGEFGDVMRQLDSRGLVKGLRNWILAGKPYFGICVGYQILFEGSDEAMDVPGLGVIQGRCVRFAEAEGKKIPQMGWNSVKPAGVGKGIWKGLGDEPYFYYVHSYFPKTDDSEWKTSTTDYHGEVFTAVVQRGNVFACQFHPEKSQDAGLNLIRNFLAE